MTHRVRGISEANRTLAKALGPLLVAAILTVFFVAIGVVAPVVGQATSSTATSTGQQGTSSISLSPSSDSVGATVTISGTGFAANRNLTATFDGSSLALGGNCLTNSGGVLSRCTFMVPPAGSGAHTITVTDGTGTARTSFTIPVITVPESTFLVTGTSVGLSFLTQLVTRRVVDLKAERRMKAEVAAFNKEKKEATLSKDKAKLEKIKKKELSVRQAQAKVSTARLKVTAITFVPLLGVYYLMASFLGGFNVVVAHSPVPIPLLVSPDGTMVLFWWYLLSSFAFSSLLTKLLQTTT